MSFRVRGLPIDPFIHLLSMDDAQLATRGIKRVIADDPQFPCRVTLAHAEVGETLLLINHEHQPAPHSPYRASGPIFVREANTQTYDALDTVPKPLAIRLLSLRAYDAQDMMIDAEVIEGSHLTKQIEKLFDNPAVAYLHAHYARRGCYAALIERA
jgi:hypothetical protein